MKKILLFIITISIAFTGFSQLTEDFENATFPPTGWASFIGTNGLGTVEDWKENGTTNKYAFVLWENVDDLTGPAEDWLVTPQFTVDAASTILKISNTVFNTTDYGGVFTIRISLGASQTTHADFTIVDTQTETDIRGGATSTVFTDHFVDLITYANQAIYVAFVWTQDDGDALGIDNVEMISNATPPDVVTTPTPADNAVDVYVDDTDGADADTDPDMRVIFDWEDALTGDAPTSYDFYIATSSAALATATPLTTVSNSTIDIVGISYSTEYFWKVVAKNVGGASPASPEWSFTTAADSTASIEDDKLEASVTIYPTTINNVFTIKNDSNTALTNLTIFDINGRVVQKENLNDLIGSKSITISNLTSGLYFVELNSANGKLVKKIIKK